MWCKGGNTVQQIISLITSGETVFAKAKNQFSPPLPPTITYFIAGNLKRAQRTITASSLHYYIEFISDISLLSPSFSLLDLKWPPPPRIPTDWEQKILLPSMIRLDFHAVAAAAAAHALITIHFVLGGAMGICRAQREDEL